MKNWSELRGAVESAIRAWGDLFVQEHQEGSLFDASVWAWQITALSNVVLSLCDAWPDRPLNERELQRLRDFLDERPEDEFEELAPLHQLLR